MTGEDSWDPARVAAAGLLAAAVGVALALVWGATVAEVLLYGAFLLGFVVAPGCLSLVLLDGREPRGLIGTLALGTGLGYLLSIFSFILTAALDLRGLYPLYPLLVLAATVPTIVRQKGWREHLARVTAPPPLGFALAVGLVASAAMLAVALDFFGQTPLPGTGPVAYFPDLSWTLALAADALHHWPMMEPGAAGEPMPYHNFIHLHLASATQVTGIELPVVFFRLWALPLVALAVLQFVEAGRSLAGSRATGLIAAGLAFLVGDFGLVTTGVMFSLLLSSPSFLFGLVVLLPLLILVGERLGLARVGEAPGPWILLAAFALGAGGAKVSILPLLIAAVAIFGLTRWWRERRFPVVPAGAGAVLLLAQAYWYLHQYAGHSSEIIFDSTAGFDLLKAISPIGPDRLEALGLLPGVPGLEAAASVIAVAVGFFALAGAPLIGICWMLGRGRIGRLPAGGWLLSVFAVGLLMLVFLRTASAANHLYFVYYGMAAGLILSAAGLRFAFARFPFGLSTLRWAVLGLMVALVLAGFLTVSGVFDTALTPTDVDRQILYGFAWLAMGMAVLATIAFATRAGAQVAAAVVVATCLGAGLLDAPTGRIKESLSQSPPSQGYRMTDGLYRALAWLREESDPDDVIVVNNQRSEEFTGLATAYDYPAFSERRYWLAGWGYSIAARNTGHPEVKAGANPFAGREELNRRVLAGDPAAIAELRSAGVRYVLVDRISGDPADLAALRRSGTVVFRDPDAVIVELD